jgi:hypothetical protein
MVRKLILKNRTPTEARVVNALPSSARRNNGRCLDGARATDSRSFVVALPTPPIQCGPLYGALTLALRTSQKPLDSLIRADVRVCGHGLKPSVSFLAPRILSVCWPSSRIAIVRSNMCSGRALSFIRPTACPCGKWRGARASADPRSGAGKRDMPSRVAACLEAVKSSSTISPRPRPRGSTLSRASSRSSHAAQSDAEPSIPSMICRTRSHATSTPTIAIVGRSHGPLPPKRSSKKSLRSLYLLPESVRQSPAPVPPFEHFCCRILRFTIWVWSEAVARATPWSCAS